MFVNFLRKSMFAAVIMLLFRLYLGYEWATGGWGKLTEGEFDATGFLQNALTKATGEHPDVQGWWAAFLEHVAIPHAGLFSFLVEWGELLVGIALILGLFTTFAALMAAIMNFSFLFSGTVSTNAQMILLTIFILVAGSNAGRFGLDYYVLPYLRSKLSNKKENQPVEKTM